MRMIAFTVPRRRAKPSGLQRKPKRKPGVARCRPIWLHIGQSKSVAKVARLLKSVSAN